MEKRLANFKAGRGSLEGVLGSLENNIMEALWNRGESSGREVFEQIKDVRDIALTTVLTVIERLVKKGLVKKERGDSTYIYMPAYTRAEFSKNVSRDVFKRVMQMSKSDAVASFVDIVADVDPNELDRLSKLIEAKKREIHKDMNDMNSNIKMQKSK